MPHYTEQYFCKRICGKVAASACRDRQLNAQLRWAVLISHCACADDPYIPVGPPAAAPVPGAENLARSLAIDLARQRVLAETATSKNQQQRLDQAFSAIKDFELAHSPVTQLRNIRGSSNDLDKLSMAANFRKSSSSQSFADPGHPLISESPTASFTGEWHTCHCLHSLSTFLFVSHTVSSIC